MSQSCYRISRNLRTIQPNGGRRLRFAPFFARTRPRRASACSVEPHFRRPWAQQLQSVRKGMSWNSRAAIQTTAGFRSSGPWSVRVSGPTYLDVADSVARSGASGAAAGCAGRGDKRRPVLERPDRRAASCIGHGATHCSITQVEVLGSLAKPTCLSQFAAVLHRHRQGVNQQTAAKPSTV